MTRAERIKRNRAIMAAYCAGIETSEQIAARFGVTARHISNIAKKSGLAKPRGRPAALPFASDDQLKRYRGFRRHHGAAMAREMVGVA